MCIRDRYWFDGMPYLENCLNDGFLKAKNRDKMKFYLMWANHDVNYTWDIRLSWEQDCLIWKGAVNREEFENACRRVITQYFGQSNYYLSLIHISQYQRSVTSLVHWISSSTWVMVA